VYVECVSPRLLVTLVEPAQTFYRAEEYHQRYLEKQGRSSCTADLARAESASLAGS